MSFLLLIQMTMLMELQINILLMYITHCMSSWMLFQKHFRVALHTKLDIFMIYSTIRMDAIKLCVCQQWSYDLLCSRSWFSQSLDLCSINIMVLFALYKY